MRIPNIHSAAARASTRRHHRRRHLSTDTKPRPIFVAATKQHVGKTTTSLALMSGLQKQFDKVGFIKPVGQQHVTVHSPSMGCDVRVDKDICLLKEQFHLDHIDYTDMSPGRLR